ncbi:MAG: Tex-like N-terminal domain-containing protein, partial [Polyangiaceae bacterium]
MSMWGVIAKSVPDFSDAKKTNQALIFARAGLRCAHRMTITFDLYFSQKHPAISIASAQTVLALAEGGATLPFIARYRKEQTGNLDEVAIQSVLEAKEAWDTLEKRKKTVLDEIEKQGKLAPELKEKILATTEIDRLEEIYLPYKQKRKTKAALA